MKQLQSGQHFGAAKKILQLEGTILTEAGYTPHIEVPWHYHENAYFYYHVKGRLNEVNKKQNRICTPGTLLFHHWQDPHYNKNFSTDAVFFHVELEKSWFDKHYLNPAVMEGCMHLVNPSYKAIFQKIYSESKINDKFTQLAVDGYLLQSFAAIMRHSQLEIRGVPAWVIKIKEILADTDANGLTLQQLSRETGVHPVHLSKEFPRYFNAGFGDYIRDIKIERAATLLASNESTLSGIAYECGFADQSHFTRCFKASHGITPLQYRNIVRKH
jgi:AraC family transcriptional regulator